MPQETILSKWTQVELLATLFLPCDFDAKSEEVIEISNVNMPVGIDASVTGLTLLYGFSGSNLGLIDAYELAVKNSKALHLVNIKMLLNSTDDSFLKLESLNVVEFINTRRITKELCALFCLYLARYEKKNNIKSLNVNSVNKLNSAISQKPRFLDYLVEQPEFLHIHAIAYPVYMENNELSARVNLYKKSKIKRRNIKCKSLIYANIQLPTRLQ